MSVIHKKGSVVKIASCHLLDSKEDMMAMMGHHTRPYIYGVIEEDVWGYNPNYSVSWAICGIFNMRSDEVMEINAEK